MGGGQRLASARASQGVDTVARSRPGAFAVVPLASSDCIGAPVFHACLPRGQDTSLLVRLLFRVRSCHHSRVAPRMNWIRFCLRTACVRSGSCWAAGRSFASYAKGTLCHSPHTSLREAVCPLPCFSDFLPGHSQPHGLFLTAAKKPDQELFPFLDGPREPISTPVLA